MKNVNGFYSKFRIIIIEDDEGLGRLMQKELERHQYNVLLAQTGQKALILTEGEKTEILLVDYKLPDMTGDQLIKKLQEKNGYTPNFITLTGYGNEKIAVEMMKLGSRDYIIKDQNFIELLLRVLNRLCAHLDNEIELEETKVTLNKTTDLLRETGELARVGGWEMNLSTNQMLWTETTKKIHEVDEDYIPDLSTSIDFFPGDARKKIEKALNLAIEKGESYSLELPFVTAKGKKLWVIAEGKPQMKNGKCIRLFGAFQDITKRKQAELELKKKTAISERTEQISHVGSWDWDIESDIVIWSEELFRIFKRDPKLGAVSYAEHPKIYTPSSMKKLDEAVQKCIETGESFELDLEIIRGDGKTAFCTSRGYARKDENGKIVQLYGSLQDITQRKETEEKLKVANQILKESEQHLMAANQQLEAFNQQLVSSEQQLKAANQQLASNEQQLRVANQQLLASEKALLENNKTLKKYFDVVAEIVVLLDEKGDIQQLNESGHRILGYKPGELIGKNWFSNCLLKEERKKIKDYFLKLKMSEDERAVNYENEIITKSNERKVILWHNSIFRDDDGNFRGTLSSGEDITLRKRNEEKLIRAYKKAEEADRLKSAFLANMSHEIRTPMNGILGFTNLLLNPELSSEQKESFIEIVHQSGQRLLNTVDDILEISKIEAGLVKLNLTETDVNKRMEELFRFFQPEADKKGLKLSVEMYLPAKDKNIITDQNKLDSILTNLIKNAIKFTADGEIKVGCKVKMNNLEFYVKDTGIGIPKNRQQVIFNRFEQADIKDTRAFEGSGLGLTIFKAYVEMMGGKIWVESEKGKGSTFYFNLPLKVSKQKKTETKSANEEKNLTQSGTKLKILIAEDDTVSYQFLSVLLKKYTREILHATNGEKAVEMCKQQPDIDLILMDIQMPGLNGYDATQEIRKFNKEVFIISQTAFALSGDHEKAIEAGCNDYISKPININILLHKISKLERKDKMA